MRLLAIFLLLLAGLCRSQAELPAGWSTDYTNSLEQAKTRNQPLVIWFTASWCAPCRLMARTTLTNLAVVQALAGLNHIAIDIDEHADIAKAHAVSAVPTFQMRSPTGDEIASLTGYQEPAAFIEWITNGVNLAKESALRLQHSREALAAADQLLQGNEPGFQEKAVASLLDLCADPTISIQEAANARLNAVAGSKPALLLPGLSHPRLAVRIRAANLLRARLGDAFDLDPWADAASRLQGVALWRAKLSDL
jgi:thioredoxin-like negative regulator of GroEL